MDGILSSLRILNYVSLSAISFMVYDALLSFVDEITYIWAAVWSLPKVLYIVSRYYPIIHLSVLFYVRNLAHAPQKLCAVYTWYTGFGGIIAIVPPVTAIFTLRVCAIYGNSRPIVAFLSLIWLVETVCELITTIHVEIGQHGDSSIRVDGPGCLIDTAVDPALYRFELLAWIPALVASFTLFVLTLYKLGYIFPAYLSKLAPGARLRSRLESEDIEQNRVLVSLIKDGTIYFFLIFSVTAVSMTTDLSPKLSSFNDWFHPWFIVTYSVSGTRLVLNIRRSSSFTGSSILQHSADNPIEFVAIHPQKESVNGSSGRMTSTVGGSEIGSSLGW